MNQALFVLYEFLLNVFTVLGSFLIKLIIFSFNLINSIPQVFHVVHENKNIIFELWWQIAKSFFFEHVELVDPDVLKVFGVNSPAVFLDLKLQFF